MNEYPTDAEPRRRRKIGLIVWLGVIMAVIAALYSAAWFYMSDIVAGQTRQVLTRLSSANGVRVNCEDMRVDGFPLDLGVACDSLLYEDAQAGYSLSSGPARTAARLYAPDSVSGEIAGPARITVPGLPAFIADWNRLDFFGDFDGTVPQALSIDADQPSAILPGGETLGAAQSLAMSSSLDGADLEVSGEIVGAALDQLLLQGRVLPPLTLSVDGQLDNGAAYLAEGASSLRGRSGQIDRLALRTTQGEASMTLSGPFTIDDQGRIDADLTIDIEQPEQLGAILADLFPENAGNISSAFGMLGSMGGGAPSVPLTIRAGRPSILFVRFQELPPLR